jgi:GNAT superfamily N-acetyltransferase
MDIQVRKLEASDRTDEFDCGDAQLNEYLKRYAIKDHRRMFGVTYAAVCCDTIPCRVIGYFTLANTSIPRQGLPDSLLKGIPKYSGLPAFLLGRIAIDKAHQRKGIGEVLLSRCFEHCLTISKLSGARYLIADVRTSAITWYEQYNFRKVEGSSTDEWTKMFVDLKVVAQAIDHKAAAAGNPKN